MGGSGGFWPFVVLPGVDTDEVHGRRAQEVLQSGFGFASVLTPAHTNAAGRLGYGAFDSSTFAVAGLPCLAFLLGSALAEGVPLGTDHEFKAAAAQTGIEVDARAPLTQRTVATDPDREGDPGTGPV